MSAKRLCQRSRPTYRKLFHAELPRIDPWEQEPLVVTTFGPVDDQPRETEIGQNMPEKKEVFVRLYSRPGVKRLSGEPTSDPCQQHAVEVIFGRDAKIPTRLEYTIQLLSQFLRLWNVLDAFPTHNVIKIIVRNSQAKSVVLCQVNFGTSTISVLFSYSNRRRGKVNRRDVDVRQRLSKPRREFSTSATNL